MTRLTAAQVRAAIEAARDAGAAQVRIEPGAVTITLPRPAETTNPADLVDMSDDPPKPPRPKRLRPRKSGELSDALRYEIFKRDDWTCAYCGTRDIRKATIDHIKPIALGGDDDPENLTTACKSCNSSKGAKTLEEWTEWKQERAH